MAEGMTMFDIILVYVLYAGTAAVLTVAVMVCFWICRAAGDWAAGRLLDIQWEAWLLWRRARRIAAGTRERRWETELRGDAFVVVTYEETLFGGWREVDTGVRMIPTGVQFKRSPIDGSVYWEVCCDEEGRRWK